MTLDWLALKIKAINLIVYTAKTKQLYLNGWKKKICQSINQKFEQFKLDQIDIINKPITKIMRYK